MTGVDILKLTKQLTDQSFSQYWDNFRWNRTAKQSLINVIQNIYNTRLNFQNSYDEISYLIVTSQVYNINSATNSIYLGNRTLPLISVWPTGTILTVTSTLPHDLLTGMRITFSNIVASGSLGSIINQTYVVTVTDPVTFTVTTTTALSGTFTSGNVTFPDSILDYYHFLRAEVRFTKLTDFTVVNSTFTTPIKITLNTRSYLMNKDEVIISGIVGNTNANGTFFLKQANDFDYLLYADKNLRTPIVGNGTQTGIGTVSEILKSTMKFKVSDEKGSIYGKPTIQNPFYQQSKNFLRILPEDEPCDWAKFDYMRKPPYFIDVNDSTYDLTNNYNEPMQYQIITEMAAQFDGAIRDMLRLQIDTTEKIQNI